MGDPAPVTVLGIDETRRGKPRWTRDQVSGRWLRTDPWDTGFVDLGLFGQIESRAGSAVHTWLGEQSPALPAGVTHVVIDPSAAYAAPVTTEVLPHAVLLVDHFHLVKLANDALTPRAFASMWNALIDSDPSCQIPSAYIAKEEPRQLLAATAPMRPKSAPGPTGSTAGAPTPTSPNCTA